MIEHVKYNILVHITLCGLFSQAYIYSHVQDKESFFSIHYGTDTSTFKDILEIVNHWFAFRQNGLLSVRAPAAAVIAVSGRRVSSRRG